VYLKVSPMNGVKRFGMKGKLAPRYIRPFPILEKCETMAYKVELPPALVGAHNIFHVSQLKKCLKASVDVVLSEVTPLAADLTYPKHSIKILDQKDHGRVKTSSVLTIWSLSYHSDGTCDCSLFLLRHFSFSNLGMRFCFSDEGCNTPCIYFARLW
jgi:hypothetical protein